MKCYSHYCAVNKFNFSRGNSEFFLYFKYLSLWTSFTHICKGEHTYKFNKPTKFSYIYCLFRSKEIFLLSYLIYIYWIISQYSSYQKVKILSQHIFQLRREIEHKLKRKKYLHCKYFKNIYYYSKQQCMAFANSQIKKFDQFITETILKLQQITINQNIFRTRNIKQNQHIETTIIIFP